MSKIKYVILPFFSFVLFSLFSKWIGNKGKTSVSNSLANATGRNNTNTNTSNTLTTFDLALYAMLSDKLDIIGANTNKIIEIQKTNNSNTTLIVKNNEIVMVKAGANFLHGQCVVITGETAYPFNPSNLSHAQLSKGIIRTTTTANSECAVQLEGEVFIAGWNLTANTLYYFGANGFLTPNAPSTGVVQAAGSSTAAEKFNIQIGEPRIRTTNV